MNVCMYVYVCMCICASMCVYGSIIYIQKLYPSASVYGGFKLHGVEEHTVEEIEEFGQMKYLCTSPFEHQHVPDGIKSFQRTSKRSKTLTREMLLSVRIYAIYYCRLFIIWIFIIYYYM
jgi:hypothetical protein